jgi:hypothetical protein
MAANLRAIDAGADVRAQTLEFLDSARKLAEEKRCHTMMCVLVGEDTTYYVSYTCGLKRHERIGILEEIKHTMLNNGTLEATDD